MAVNSDVLALVQRALKKDPTLRSKELQERAARVDKSVENLTTRQFHARYALQAKKNLAGPRKKKRKRPTRSKRGAKRRAAPQKRTDPVRELLRERFEESKAHLSDAMESAFDRSIRADSLAGVNDLLSSVEGLTRELQQRK